MKRISKTAAIIAVCSASMFAVPAVAPADAPVAPEQADARSSWG